MYKVLTSPTILKLDIINLDNNKIEMRYHNWIDEAQFIVRVTRSVRSSTLFIWNSLVCIYINFLVIEETHI